MDKTILDAISDQVNLEFYSSHLYLSMAGYCDEQHLPGFAHWLIAQAEEERGHAIRLIKFVEKCGARVKLKAIDEPPADFKSPLSVFESILEHEKFITSNIHNLYELAGKKKDYATQIELQWFINEQVEEEQTADELLHVLRKVKDSPQGLVSLDRQLARRGA